MIKLRDDGEPKLPFLTRQNEDGSLDEERYDLHEGSKLM